MYPYVTIQIVTIGAKVMAFEPLPSSAGLLRASLRFNDGGNHGGTTSTGSYWVHLGPQASKPLRNATCGKDCAQIPIVAVRKSGLNE